MCVEVFAMTLTVINVLSICGLDAKEISAETVYLAMENAGLECGWVVCLKIVVASSVFQGGLCVVKVKDQESSFH